MRTNVATLALLLSSPAWADGALIIFSCLLVPLATFVAVLIWAKGWGLGRRFCGGLLTMPPAFIGFGFVAGNVMSWLGPGYDLVALALGLVGGSIMAAVPLVIMSIPAARRSTDRPF